MESIYNVPIYVSQYCKGRTSEIIEYLTDKEYSRLIRNPEIKVKVLDNEKGSIHIRCLITRRVLPLTVLKNPMLLRAAELEFKTYNGEYPISIQEARWILIDEYPQTNCIAQPYSCLELIRKRKNQFKLCLEDTIRISEERRGRLCVA